MPKSTDSKQPVSQPSVNLADVVTLFAQNWVNHPQDVRVTSLDGTQTQIIELKVNDADTGLMIGKGGETIQTLNQLISVLSQGRARIDMVNPKRERKQ